MVASLKLVLDIDRNCGIRFCNLAFGEGNRLWSEGQVTGALPVQFAVS